MGNNNINAPAQAMPMQNQQTGLKNFNLVIKSDATQEYLQKILGDKKQSFITSVTSLVANNGLLQACDPMTVMYAAIKAVTLDLPLDPNLGLAYVIPYKDNKRGVVNAQFQIGYLGFVEMAVRSQLYETINVTDVKEGELIDDDLLTGKITLKRAQNRESLATIGYCAFFRMNNGYSKSLYMSKADCEKHAGHYSQSFKFGNSVWNDGEDGFDAMAKKTVLKLLLKRWGTKTVNMVSAQQTDQSVWDRNGNATYLDNPKSDGQVIDTIATEVAQEIPQTAQPAQDAQPSAPVNSKQAPF